MTKAEARERREIAKTRLKNYLDREASMLTDGAQSYGTGTRSLTRYQTNLADIRAEIKALQKEIAQLDAIIEARPRHFVGRIIPID